MAGATDPDPREDFRQHVRLLRHQSCPHAGAHGRASWAATAPAALPSAASKRSTATRSAEDEAIRLGVIKPKTKWNTRGTIGVALSHRNLWDKAIAEKRSLIVFEDDA